MKIMGYSLLPVAIVLVAGIVAYKKFIKKESL
jgi:hypothetical protein